LKPQTDVRFVPISDTHCGGTTALFPDYMMTFKNGEKEARNHTQTPTQKILYKHLMDCADKIKPGNMRRIIVVNGDAIEGHHHGTIQVVSTNPVHHVEIFNDVFENFLFKAGFSVKRGDELHFISGTESHTGWVERDIAANFSHLGATFQDELDGVWNGRRVWFTHHGANPGGGHSEGDGYRNWLKRIYFDCDKEGREKPDIVVSSHYHKSLYQTYVRDWHTIHGMVTPSFQKKTRFGLRAAPFEKNDIGISPFVITAGGLINFEKPMLLDPKVLR